MIKMVHVPFPVSDESPEIAAIRLAWQIRSAVEDRSWEGIIARELAAPEQQRAFLSDCLAGFLASHHDALKAHIAGKIATLTEHHPTLVAAYVGGREG